MAIGDAHGDIPRDSAATNRMQSIIADMEQELTGDSLDPAVSALGYLLESDQRLNHLCVSMFAETKELVRAGRAHPAYLAIGNIEILMRLFDYILTRSPEWEDADSPNNLRGLPFNLVLMVLMETPSGRQLFKQATVNEHLRLVLKRWAQFLDSPQSLYALNAKDGWLSRSALAKLEDVANSPTEARQNFTDIFECPDPTDPNTFGFASWDAFFSRTLKPGVRPTPSREILVERAGYAVLNACESRPWQIARHPLGYSAEIGLNLKGKSYSVRSMLDNDPLSEHFVRGTVYQAYLSALSYHRWHSPVSGVIRKILYIDGTYFSQLPMSDILSMEKSQNYLAAVATRAAVFIDAADQRVGLICFVGVGMGEVSSCEAFVKAGDYVEAGDEIGSFHYGGSTHCLLFREGVNVQFEPWAEDQRRENNIPVRSLLARCFA
ncbi:putative phosphatidylserine decarboxylase [Aspergillus undulatus]|uniref:putative phosphatidylserine decarboxylase n=1 Tax=Aspergillus undulatus TaxID=1810928 RepID=UPI003CCDD7D2